jgi:hypothetical protein
MYAGLCDGSYGQDRGYSFATEPWIVDFELRRTHELATDFGMGSLSMFSPPNTELERMYYLPGAPNGRDALIDSFLAATIAFGHSGYLVLDGCWDPPKPFGPAYGVPCRAKWKECGLPNEALRSYFMIQALAALYTQASAVETLYYDKSGRAYDLSAAVIEGVVGLNRVVTRYSDGTVTAVNGGNDGGFEVEIGGRKVVLSSFGYAGSGNGVEVLSTVVDGRRVDFAEGPEYRYREVRGERPEVTLK